MGTSGALSVTHELTVEGRRDSGKYRWLLTSAYALGRSVRSGELVSMRWVSLAGADVGASREIVVINMGNGRSGRLSGPGALPIAVLVGGHVERHVRTFGFSSVLNPSRTLASLRRSARRATSPWSRGDLR